MTMQAPALVLSPEELFEKHLGIVQDYARRVVGQEQTFTVAGEADKNERISKLFAAGASLKLTKGEMVKQIFWGTFKPPPAPQGQCQCYVCEARRGRAAS